MKSDRIRRALAAGRRWAERELKSGTRITADSAIAAAARYDHRGSRELFCRAALDVALRNGPGEEDDGQHPVQDCRDGKK